MTVYQQVKSLKEGIDKPLHAFDTDMEWQALASSILENSSASPPIVLVCGAKGSGKSSLARILCNHFLSRKFGTCGVGLLDLDPGQPEYSPSANISLMKLKGFNLGPPFSHPALLDQAGTTLRAHFLGTCSPKDDIAHYVKSSEDLFSHYEETLRKGGSPLIINCCGWIQGSGLDMLADLIRFSRPTDIVYLKTEDAVDATPLLGSICEHVGAKLHHRMSKAPNDHQKRTASNLREMQSCSYFHLAAPEEGALRWTPEPLSLQEVMHLPFAGPGQTFEGFLLLGDATNFDKLAEAISGTVLALVAIEDSTMISHANDITQISQATESNQIQRASEPLSPGLRVTARVKSLRNGVPISDETPTYMLHLSTEGMPYLLGRGGVNRAPDPMKSCSLGQVLVQRVDMDSKQLAVVTPIQAHTIQRYRRMNTPLFLVRGNIGAAVWSYTEEYCEMLSAKRIHKHWKDQAQGQIHHNDMHSDRESDGEFSLGNTVRKRPWVELSSSRSLSQRSKIWRVRRNLAT